MTRCDALLVALILARFQSLEPDAAAVVVSSSEVLRTAFSPYQDRLGSSEPVMTVAAIGYIPSLVPGVQLSLKSLRSVLFDAAFASLLPGGGDPKQVLRSARAGPSPLLRPGTMRSQVRARVIQRPGTPRIT